MISKRTAARRTQMLDRLAAAQQRAAAAWTARGLPQTVCRVLQRASAGGAVLVYEDGNIYDTRNNRAIPLEGIWGGPLTRNTRTETDAAVPPAEAHVEVVTLWLEGAARAPQTTRAGLLFAAHCADWTSTPNSYGLSSLGLPYFGTRQLRYNEVCVKRNWPLSYSRPVGYTLVWSDAWSEPLNLAPDAPATLAEIISAWALPFEPEIGLDYARRLVEAPPQYHKARGPATYMDLFPPELQTVLALRLMETSP